MWALDYYVQVAVENHQRYSGQSYWLNYLNRNVSDESTMNYPCMVWVVLEVNLRDFDVDWSRVSPLECGKVMHGES